MTRVDCSFSLAVPVAVLLLAGCPKPGSNSSGEDAGMPPITECDAPSSRVPLRLLTRAEYDNTLHDLLGDDSNPSRDFPREPLAEGWDNDGNLNQVTDESIARYLEASEVVAAQTASQRPDWLYRCPTKNSACAAQFIATMGRRLYRRALADDETLALTTFFNTTEQNNDFDTAVEWTLQLMLQSPQFLYRVEEGADPKKNAWRTPLNGPQMASRLSYFLWASAPDDTLLDAAATGALADPEALKAQATRMLKDAKAARGKARFFDLWLRLGDIGGLEKSAAAYPAFTPALATAWRASLDLFINDVLENEDTLAALLTSNSMFVNDQMSMYGSTQTSSTFTKVSMPATQRNGLLTQPGFLARLSGPDQSSPIRRGIFVLDKLLCQVPPPPPANVDTTPPKVDLGGTTRQRFAQHSSNGSCAGCHTLIDPVGFGFEHYDGLGAWRDTDNGQPVDSTGGIAWASDETLVGPFNGVPELMGKLSRSKQVHDCFSKEWLRFAMGRGLGDGDACSVDSVQTQFMTSGGDFNQLLLAIVGSDTFRTRPVEAL